MAGRNKFGRISDADFASVLKTLSATPKGRGFLEEYRLRCQSGETLALLQSLQRIEATMASVRSQLQPERLAEELRHLAMSLEIALDGIDSDPEGDDTARRFALADRARRELVTLIEGLAGSGELR